MPYDEYGDWYDEDFGGWGNPEDPAAGSTGYEGNLDTLPPLEPSWTSPGYDPGPLDPLEPSVDYGGYDPYVRDATGYDPTPNGGGNSIWNFLKNFKMDGGSGNGLGSLGAVAGKSAAAAALGRKSEAEIMNDLMRNQIARGQLEVNQKKFTSELPQTYGKQSLMGSILANAQDVKIQPWNDRIKVPTVTGGMRPSMLTPQSRQLGSQLVADALTKQKTPPSFTPVPDPKYPEAGFMEKMNTGIAGGSSIANTGLSIWDLINKITGEPQTGNS